MRCDCDGRKTADMRMAKHGPKKERKEMENVGQHITKLIALYQLHEMSDGVQVHPSFWYKCVHPLVRIQTIILHFILVRCKMSQYLTSDGFTRPRLSFRFILSYYFDVYVLCGLSTDTLSMRRILFHCAIFISNVCYNCTV